MFQFDLNNLLSVRSLVGWFGVLLFFPRLSYTLLFLSISEGEMQSFFIVAFFLLFSSSSSLSVSVKSYTLLYEWPSTGWISSFLTSFAFPSSECRQIYSILKIMYFHSVLHSSFYVVCLNLLTEQQASHFVHPYIYIYTLTSTHYGHNNMETGLSHLFASLTLTLFHSRCWQMHAVAVVAVVAAIVAFYSNSPLLPFVLSFFLLKQKYSMYYKQNTQKSVKTKEQ